MKIGVISDVHGNYLALKAVIEDMNKRNIESVIVLGDIIFGGSEPLNCFQTIKDLKPIAWIKGNTDNWFNEIDDSFKPNNDTETRIHNEYLDAKRKIKNDLISIIKNLPENKEIEIEGTSILCVHGSDRINNEPLGIMTPFQEKKDLFNRINSKIILCGHTHCAYITAFNGKVLMNVGSVGLPRDGDMPSYGILNIEKDNLEYSIRRVKVIN